MQRARFLPLFLGLASLTGSAAHATPLRCASTVQTGDTVQTEDPEQATVLRLGDREVSWSEYATWLVRKAGSRHIQAATLAQLVGDALADAHQDVTVADVHAQVDAQVARRIELAFGGDRALWIAELERTGSSEETFYATRAGEALAEVRERRLVMAHRKLDEAGLKQAWEALHGPNGRQPELRALFLEIKEPMYPDGADEFGKQMLRDAKRKQVRRKANEVLRRSRAGEDFGVLVAELSQDAASRELEGYLPDRYTISDWPEGLANALRTTQPGHFLGPVLARGGYWAFELMSVTETPFDSVRDEILEHQKTAPPSPAETRALHAELLAGVEPRVLPELWKSPADAAGRMDRPVVSFDDRVLTRHDLALWLTGQRGFAESRQFIEMQLIAALATEAGIAVTELDVQQRIESGIAARVELEHRGDRDAWLRKLAAAKSTEEIFRLEQTPRTRHGLLTEQLLLAGREVTDIDVRALWVDRYGPGGESPRIRLILRKPAPLPRGTNPSPEQVDEYLAQQELEISTLLNELHERITNGEDFATLAKRYSQDPKTKDRGGLQAHRFRLDQWPTVARDAIDTLVVGGLSPMVEIGTDYYMFENSGVTHVALDEVAAALRKELEERRPASIEVARYLSRIVGESAVQLDAPALIAPYITAATAPR